MSDDNLRVEFEAKRTVSAIVDMVEHFKNIPHPQHAAYWGLDLELLGFDDEEFSRPIAWIIDALGDDFGGAGMVRGAIAGFDDGEIADWDVRVKARRYDIPTPDFYRPYQWSEADFLALVAAVPWLKPDDTGAPPDTSRMPGPYDQPLFDLPPEETP